MDGDGDEDLIAGNLGLNTKLNASEEAPTRLWLGDFDDNGQLDPILTYPRDGTSYPLVSQDELFRQIKPLKKRFSTYAEFGARQVEDIFSKEKLEEAEVREAYTFASSYAENNGDGTFTTRPLPMRAQFAPVYGLVADDVDRDGHKDIVLAGNFYGVKPVRGRYDASYGLLLRGTGRSQGEPFEAVRPAVSNLWMQGQIRELRLLDRGSLGHLLLGARNDGPLQVLQVSGTRSEEAVASVVSSRN